MGRAACRFTILLGDNMSPRLRARDPSSVLVPIAVALAPLLPTNPRIMRCEGQSLFFPGGELRVREGCHPSRTRSFNSYGGSVKRRNLDAYSQAAEVRLACK